MGRASIESLYRFLKKVKINLSYKPPMPLLGMSLKLFVYYYRNNCKTIYSLVLYFKYLSYGNSLNICEMFNGILSFTHTHRAECMVLKNSILNQVAHSQIDGKHCTFLLYKVSSFNFILLYSNLSAC